MPFWWFSPSTLITNSQMVIAAPELHAACLMYVSPEVNSVEIPTWGIIALTENGNINAIIM